MDTKFLLCVSLVLLAWVGPACARTIHIVALRTSFTACKGVWASQALPAQLAQRLRAAGLDAAVINAGINGDSTADLAAGLSGAVPAGTDIVILEYALGNDMKRGTAGRKPSITSRRLFRVCSPAESGCSLWSVAAVAPD